MFLAALLGGAFGSGGGGSGGNGKNKDGAKGHDDPSDEVALQIESIPVSRPTPHGIARRIGPWFGGEDNRSLKQKPQCPPDVTNEDLDFYKEAAENAIKEHLRRIAEGTNPDGTPLTEKQLENSKKQVITQGERLDAVNKELERRKQDPGNGPTPTPSSNLNPSA